MPLLTLLQQHSYDVSINDALRRRVEGLNGTAINSNLWTAPIQTFRWMKTKGLVGDNLDAGEIDNLEVAALMNP